MRFSTVCSAAVAAVGIAGVAAVVVLALARGGRDSPLSVPAGVTPGLGAPVQGGASVGAAVGTLNPVLAGVQDTNGLVQPQLSGSQSVLLPLAARTAQVNTPTQSNAGFRGAIVVLNVTAASGTGGLTPILQVQDAVSGTWINYSTGPSAITTTGFKVVVYYPGPSSGLGGNVIQSVQAPLPSLWRLTVAVGDATSYSYSVSCSMCK